MSGGWKAAPIDGALLTSIAAGSDFRGRGMKVLDAAGLAVAGVDFRPEESFFITSNPGVLRGMHGQTIDRPQAKLVSCLDGRVHDVLLDLRPGSPTFGRHFATELSAANGSMIYVPEGVLHGFAVLGDQPACVLIQAASPHVAEASVGVRWDSFGHEWPLSAPILSARDTELPTFETLLNPLS